MGFPVITHILLAITSSACAVSFSNSVSDLVLGMGFFLEVQVIDPTAFNLGRRDANHRNRMSMIGFEGHESALVRSPIPAAWQNFLPYHKGAGFSDFLVHNTFRN
jgi:hypothetical protein